RRLVKIAYVSLPNILAGQELVKEFIQQECSVDNLYHELTRLLQSDNQALLDKFTEMHHWIRKDADQQAAQAVLTLIGK
ncbi:hypothetical protein, partial [Bacillus cereus group sp. BC329]|uniref:hypothetical protein n=1 Tax=Bacillus cereus group sp. BC329 TaxID=3445307 RepID=UPI003F6A2773